ncbi:thioredoxin-like domain-containing protein [Polystyrenella longa]|nr:thioredoxin-like domain-containing protein [Polystyrenella longa]
MTCSLMTAFFLLCCTTLSCAAPETESKDSEPDTTAEADAENLPEYPRPAKLPLSPNLLDIPDGEWLNTSGPISMEDLRGKIVIFDFWTYCCINCIHVLPDLEYLEEKYPNELVVIGVHSAKFDNEKISDNIREAIMRYEIKHPVLNDREMSIWRKIGVRAWPTLVLIDAEGNACLLASGEGNRELMDKFVGELIEYHDARDQLDRTPIDFDLEREKQPVTPLKYPGKLLVDEQNDRLFISDSNHNRIVISSLDGKLIDVIGSGGLGTKDGGYAEATFDHAQGMALHEDILYIADTENHLIRAVDLKQKQVKTLIGTGEQARSRQPSGEISTFAINSPWALEVHNGTLFIAMAGPHQIWQHEIGSDTVSVYAGSGREDIVDGSLSESALAQPSSLKLHNGFLYVADSEGSSIREVPTDPGGKVRTILGTHDLEFGQSLFAFGDKDGKGTEARLQHPLGLAFAGDTLYVADSYNHKIKQVEFEKDKSGNNVGVATTILGSGDTGTSLDPLELSEPAGLAVIGNNLLIADTNNHRIVKYDLTTKAASEFVVAGLTSPKLPKSGDSDEIADSDIQTLKAVTIQVGTEAEILVQIAMPEGYKLNKLYPANIQLESSNTQLFQADQLGKRLKPEFASDTELRLALPVAAEAGKGDLTLKIRFGYCRDGKGGLCKVSSMVLKLPVTTEAGSDQRSISIPVSVE